MTQWGDAQPQAGARVNTIARTAIWITVGSVVLALAIFCVFSKAVAETYTPHARRITARYTTAHFVTHHTRASGRAAGPRAVARTTSYRLPAARGRRPMGRSPRFEPVREPASSRRTSAWEKRSARSAQQASPSMHRVNGRHRGSERRHRRDRLEVVAGTDAPAADSLVSGVYASGVAHPYANVSRSMSATSRLTEFKRRSSASPPD